MSEKIVRYLLDDMEENEIDADAGTVQFGIDGQNYEIDLCNKNATKLRSFLEPFKANARPAGTGKKPSLKLANRVATHSSGRGGEPSGYNKEQLAAIREWGRRNGWPDLSDKGRIPGIILDAFEQKHQEQGAGAKMVFSS